MAVQQYDDSAIAKYLGSKYWNHFAIQLGHWNSMKVIIMSGQMFKRIPDPAKAELATEMAKYLGEEVMYARDADNEEVWILGPMNVMKRDITMVKGIPIWDPKKKHVTTVFRLRRPPNAYILYRKDKHGEVKAENPGLDNNEISVIIGAMWKAESSEVRAEYHEKAQEVKRNLMIAYPDYRYIPRKSHEIRRRARRAPRLQLQAPQDIALLNRAHAPASFLWQQPMQQAIQQVTGEENSPNSEITRHIPQSQRFLPPIERDWAPPNMERLAIEDAPAIDDNDNMDQGWNFDDQLEALLRDI
ncbi:hypothetical protein N656DRAFT_744074 [Canariomyces notabilis]|uniref:HMG box domain-containing protein n=1 Tax=Canariomyces notabilis TaxID=2074819 RepID=A0AAN6TNA6_9PEZI|nr:hypothetical protein N656DRAFT_744074 [Canariomyces arenarius]